MKIKLTKALIAIISVTFALTSCSKTSDELASVASTKQDILTFKTVEEFNTTVQKVNAMKPEERSAWEKSKGFKSFGTICDEFYSTINFDNFKNEAEVLEFIKSNNDKIQIIEHSDSSKCFETQEFNNDTRFLMNKDGMYIVGNTVYKKFVEGCIATSISNVETIANAKDFNSLKSNPIFTISYLTPKKTIQKIQNLKVPIQKVTNANIGTSFGDWDNKTTYATFRIELYLNTSTSYTLIPNPDPNKPPYVGETFRNTSCLIKNYRKGIFGFYSVQRYTTFNISVVTSDNLGLIDNSKNTTGTNQIIDSWYAPWSLFHIGYGQVQEYPYFTYVYYDAHNDEGCTVNHTYQ